MVLFLELSTVAVLLMRFSPLSLEQPEQPSQVAVLLMRFSVTL